jgi:hypothetical protein
MLPLPNSRSRRGYPDPHPLLVRQAASTRRTTELRLGLRHRIELAPEPDRDPNVLGQGCDGPAPLAGGALVHGQHA